MLRRSILLKDILCALAIVMFLFSQQTGAQTTTGQVYGTVTDTDGAVIPNAKVSITDVNTKKVQTTNSNALGEYVFPTLTPSSYSVAVAVPGFKSVTQRGVSLSSNQNVHVNFSMEIGAASDRVTVDAMTTLVDTRESQLGTTIDERRIEDLPLNTRNPYNLVTLVPGITNYSSDTTTGSRSGASFSTNGLPTSTANYYLDGSYDIAFFQNGGNPMPNPDAVQEFRILTSNFDAEFGRSPGAAINVITKSGTANFHGMVYDYLRNNIFNAKTYFTTSVTPLKQNQFGANVGGPLFPHNKAFFFLSYEGLRIATNTVISGTAIVTPTALERAGNFAQSAKIPNLPAGTNCGTTAAPVICPSAIDPVAKNLLAFLPVENPGDTGTAQQSASTATDNNQGLGRLDYQLTPAHQLEGMFFNTRGITPAPTAGGNQIIGYAGMQDSENQLNAILADSWTLSRRTFNSLRGFYMQNRYIIGSLYPGHTPASLGSDAIPGGPIFGPPQFAISGYWTMGQNGGGPSDIDQQSFGLVDTATLSRGRHNIKVGGSFVWNKYAETGGNESNGLFTFSGATTKNALADFLLGKANSFSQTNDVIHRTHQPDPALFVQDDWQVTHRLTLNLGLRWEIFAPMLGDPTLGTFAPDVQSRKFPSAPLGLLFPGDPGIPDGVFATAADAFAPRVGFADDLFGDGSTSLRGGFGIFYYLNNEPVTSDLQQQPYALSVTVNETPNLVTPYAPAADPFPYIVNPSNAVFVSGATTYAVRPDGGKVPYVEEYNLTLERQLGRQWATSIAYVGNAARKFNVIHDINAPTYIQGAANSTAGINARRPYEPSPSTYVFGAIDLNDPADNAGYNSLQTSIRGSMGHQFSLQASYVWSKVIDYAGTPVNELDVSTNRGRAATDVQNRFVASYIYQFPELHRWGVFGKEVVNGWQLNGITTLSTGAPFTVTSGSDTNLDGTNNDRPNVVGNPFFSGGRSRAQKVAAYYNKAAFATPNTAASQSPYGNEQRDLLTAPGSVDTDLSAFKTFALYRSMRLQFRGEIFNLLNNVNLSAPNATLSSPNAGKISSAGSPRIAQFALKLLF